MCNERDKLQEAELRYAKYVVFCADYEISLHSTLRHYMSRAPLGPQHSDFRENA